MLTLAGRREAWIVALESEDYDQGRGALHNRNERVTGGVSDDTDAFCCLGVGCELAMLQDWGIEVTVQDGFGELDYTCQIPDEGEDFSAHFMPKCVWKALGLDGNAGDRVRGKSDFARAGEVGPTFDTEDLAKANDDKLTFKEIAALLRSGDYWIENKKGPSEA